MNNENKNKNFTLSEEDYKAQLNELELAQEANWAKCREAKDEFVSMEKMLTDKTTSIAQKMTSDPEANFEGILKEVKELKEKTQEQSEKLTSLNKKDEELRKEISELQANYRNTAYKKKQQQHIKELNSKLGELEEGNGYCFIQQEGDYKDDFLFKSFNSRASVKVWQNGSEIICFDDEDYNTKRYKTVKGALSSLIEVYNKRKKTFDYNLEEEKKFIVGSEKLKQLNKQLIEKGIIFKMDSRTSSYVDNETIYTTELKLTSKITGDDYWASAKVCVHYCVISGKLKANVEFRSPSFADIKMVLEALEALKELGVQGSVFNE